MVNAGSQAAAGAQPPEPGGTGSDSGDADARDAGTRDENVGFEVAEQPSRSLASLWVEGARLRTLPLALAPVIAGTGVAASVPAARLDVAALCLAVALLLQIGVNYSNDYSDGVRGTDDVRVGPPRLTASKRVDARVVLRVALGFFAAAAVAGVWLVVVTGLWWLLLVGAAALVAAWFYTGGTSPYGYLGFGEVVAFVFFGLVAVLGTVYVQVGGISWLAGVVAVAQGCFAAAVLMINNVRDVDQDALAGKRTLAVRLGRGRGFVVFAVLVVIPYVLLFVMVQWTGVAALLALGSAPLAAFAIVFARRPRSPKDYVSALQLASVGSLVYAVMLGFGLSLIPYL